jgi:hypothetical protein
MPFFMLPKHLGHLKFSLGETAIVLCCGAYALRRAREPGAKGAHPLRHFVPASVFERAILLFLIVVTVATLSATYRHFALRQYRLVILEPVAYYVLVIALLRDVRTMARAVRALVGVGLLVAVLGLAQELIRPNTLVGTYRIGDTIQPLLLVNAVYGSPNNVGLLLDRTIPVALVLGLAGLATRRGAFCGPILDGLSALACHAADGCCTGVEQLSRRPHHGPGCEHRYSVVVARTPRAAAATGRGWRCVPGRGRSVVGNPTWIQHHHTRACMAKGAEDDPRPCVARHRPRQLPPPLL